MVVLKMITSGKNEHFSKNKLTISPIAMVLLGLFSPNGHAELYFPSELVSGALQTVADLSIFSTEGKQLPGMYQVDIYLNGYYVSARTVRFDNAGESSDSSEITDATAGGFSGSQQGSENTAQASDKKATVRKAYVRDNTGLTAVLTRKEMETLGVNVRLFPALMALTDEQAVSPGLYIPDAFTRFNFQKMRLDISIPQAAMKNTANGYIDPELWDEGINAVLLDYSFNGSNNHGRYGNSQSHYLNLRGGINIGAWRLRDSRTWRDNSSPGSHSRSWQHLSTYAERTIIPWKSSLLMGEGTTDSDIFDSLAFRGGRLSTDDNMYPDTMRGFAPVIRGSAATNARVSIRQNGFIIYQTYVSPGAFSITDLFPMYSSGDLEVIVKEASGSEHTFTVPYSSLPVLQREGHLKYSVTAGRFRGGSSRYDNPAFAEGTFIRGQPHDVTVYGGLQYSENYFSAALGAGISLGTLGALSADITQANSTLSDGSHYQGQSLRFLYARSLNSLGTSFRLTGYRYSTKGFHTLEETALKGMNGWRYDDDTVDPDGRPSRYNRGGYYDLNKVKRARFEASISQRLGTGSLYLSGIRQTYWNSDEVSNSLQSGFSSSLGAVTYGLSYSYSRQSPQSGADKSVYLSLSVPLDSLLSPPSSARRHSSVYATFNSSHDSSGSSLQRVGLSGSALENKNLNWSVSQGYSRHDGQSGSTSLNYQGGYGSSNVGYSYSNDYRQISYGVSGGALLHSEGLTFGQPLGDTNVLIVAPGAKGLSVDSGTGVQTDWRGYAIKPYVSAYRENRIALDTKTLDDDTDIEGTVSRVVPTKGAVVKARFVTRHGMRVLMTLTHDGKPLPMGSTVTAGDITGIVGDDGLVYLSGMQADGILTAQWGSGPDQHCTVRYRLSKKEESTDSSPVIRINETCHR